MHAIYCSSSSSLAILEILVHLRGRRPIPDYRIVDLDVPDHLIAMPAGSTADPQVIGKTLFTSSQLAFGMPSAVNAEEFNVVIDPANALFRAISVGNLRDFIFDPRL